MTSMTSRTDYSTQTPKMSTLFSGEYLRKHWTSDIGVLGYIGIVWPKEHSPEVRSFPPGTPCIYRVLFQLFLCSLKGRWYERLTHEITFLRWFRKVHVCPLVEWPLASAYHVCRCGELYMKKIYILIMIEGYNTWNQATMLNVWICAAG